MGGDPKINMNFFTKKRLAALQEKSKLLLVNPDCFKTNQNNARNYYVDHLTNTLGLVFLNALSA